MSLIYKIKQTFFSLRLLPAGLLLGFSLMPAPVIAAVPVAAPVQVVADSALPKEDPAVKCDRHNCDFIGKYVNPAIDLFSLSFGLIAVISLIFGAIQFSASEGDPQKASAAKNRIFNTIIAIFAYFFLFAFLQFLIPGGTFR